MHDERIPPRCQKQAILPIKNSYSSLPASAILLRLTFSLAFISGASPQIRAALDEVELTVLPSHSNPWWLYVDGGFVVWYTRAFEQIHASQINGRSHPQWLTCPLVDLINQLLKTSKCFCEKSVCVDKHWDWRHIRTNIEGTACAGYTSRPWGISSE